MSVKLRHLDEWNRARREVAKRYTLHMAEAEDIILPEEATYSRHIYHVYAVRAQNRKLLMEALNANGIQCGIHYPVPIHLQDAYRFLGLGKGSFPVTENCSDQFVSLPIFPEMSEDAILHVTKCVLSGLAKARAG